MRKSRLQISVLFLFLSGLFKPAMGQYHLYVRGIDKDSSSIIAAAGLRTDFPDRLTCAAFIDKLPSDLQAKGYVTASVDKIEFDTAKATIDLYLGTLFKWAQLDASRIDTFILDGIGWQARAFPGRPMDFSQVKTWQERILTYLENNGYPFAKVYLDSIRIEDDKVSALLLTSKGPLYHIDSIRVYGNAKISNSYLQRYLGLPNGSVYSKEKLVRINKKMRELTYVEEEKPASLTLLGTGSVLNMYLKQKRSSLINVIVGFLPNNDQLSSKKLLITGEANILLRNALGAGETIGLNWQQLQVKSPRLNLFYIHPYLFRTPIGLDFSFDMFRKDSTFLNVNFQLGAQYALNNNQAGKLFIQRIQTVVSQGGINQALIIQTRRLPDIADVSSFNVGVDYEFNNTDYRLNPKKGNDFRIITAIGSKKIKRNNEIVDLKDPGDPNFDFGSLYDTVKLSTYQFRARAIAARYFPLGKNRSTIKLGVHGGMFQSGNIFRNELFQIGGYKTLRGFDEESQYLSHFAIGTLEYRYLVGQNSFFYVFTDGGWGRNNSADVNANYTYIGTGMGLAFETKAGIFNLAWAVGKRNDTEFNLRQSKIHFGFVNYF